MTRWMRTHFALAALFLARAGAVPTKIVNGTTASETDYRWTAWIEKDGKVCGASLIDQNWVVTTASCIYDYFLAPSGSYNVYLGDYRPGVSDNEQQTLSCNILVNNKFDNSTYVNNIAMMELETPADVSRDNIEVVAYSSSNIKIADLNDCYLTGYGDAGNGSINGIRQSLAVTFADSSNCAGFSKFDSDQHFCYEATQGAPCNFDEGSPVACIVNGVWTQVGIQISETCQAGFQYGTWTFKNRRFISESLTKALNTTCELNTPVEIGCGPAGKSFMIGYVKPDPDDRRPALYITATQDTTVVLQPGADVSKYFKRLQFPITASNGLVLTLPAQMADHTNDGISSKSLRIYAAEDLFVTAGYTPDAIGATQVFPEECLQNFTYNYLPLGFAGGYSQLSEVIMVALGNSTSVQISGPASATFSLNELQLYRIAVDGSGLSIESSGPLAVFSGVKCGNIPDSGLDYCDTMYEQIPPKSCLQKTFILPALKPRENMYVRILAAEDNANVTVSASPSGNNSTFVLQQKKYQDVQAATVDAMVVSSDAPIIVGQYGYGGRKDELNLGDPALVVVPAIKEYATSYMLFAKSTSGYNYVAIIFSSAVDVSGLLMNGVAITGAKGTATVDVAGEGTFNIYYEELRFGVTTLAHTDGTSKFGVIQYDLEYYREAVSSPRSLYSNVVVQP